MTSRVRHVSGQAQLEVTAWQACATPPGALDGPAALAREGLGWLELRAPGTAASALRAAGQLDLEQPARRLDGEDWWFRAQLPALERPEDGELVLSFAGLATVADVWLDGAPLLSSDNMFLAHERVLAAPARELVVRCRALDPLLQQKRPRPRWRVPMAEHQQLRWLRTTLLGRTPGWSPPAPPVGPYRPVRLTARRGFAVEELRLRAQLQGATGLCDVSVRLRPLGPSAGAVPGATSDASAGANGPAHVELVLARDGREHRVALGRDGERYAGRLELREPARWWPHTHGEPALYEARLEIGAPGGSRTVELGPIGFRTIERAEPFELRVNGAPIFCRGACWTPLDPLALSSDRAAYEAALGQAARAGMNTLRVSGTMVYETDDFHDLCDRLGLLVWQDLMFANFDYPEDDPAFVASAAAEVRQQLARLQARPSLAVVCGNSEGEQQAAMWGAPRERWSPRLFHEVLPAVVAEVCPDAPYWPSSAHGGAFPHEPQVGTTSYYGVGAYLRPLEDARRSEVRFATECLAFANVPGPRGLPGGPNARVHHPAWKARTPRDLGAGWDFDDVRDHYLATLFAVEPMRLRYADHERYLELSRVVTGEVMAHTFGEWRRRRSVCTGALVWLARDLWPGAGWGLVEASGAPKAAWYYLRRALQPIAVHISDEGNSGLHLHVCNERPEPLSAEIELACFRAGEVPTANARRSLELGGRETLELNAAALFDGFHDLSWAYRFGPPSHDLVVATLRDGAGALLAQAFHFPLGLPAQRALEVGLTAETRLDGDSAQVTLRTRRFAQSIAVDVEGFQPDDSYFHLPPGGERSITLRRTSGTQAPRGTLQPLNAEATTKIVVAA